MSNIGKEIKRIRELKEISQYKLAKLSGVAQPTISAIEGDDQTRSPSIDTVQKIAHALRCTVAELTGENVSGVVLDDDEQELLNIYRQLNLAGQQLLMESAESFLAKSALRQEGYVQQVK